MTRPRPRPLALLVLAVLAAPVGGCASIESELAYLFPPALPTPTEAVVWATDRDPDRRREGLLLLANAPYGGEDPYLALYRDFVDNDRDPLVRAVAIRALAKHGAPDDARRIARHLGDENRIVRWEAAKGLQRLHAPAVVPDLVDVLRDEEEEGDVRIAAAVALGQYEGDAVFQVLVRALDAVPLGVNLAARDSLRTITRQGHGLDPAEWLDWYETVSGPEEAFAGATDYRYPTYQRDPSWFEKLAFWAPNVRELPAPPAGLVPSEVRGTYEGDDGATGSDESSGR